MTNQRRGVPVAKRHRKDFHEWMTSVGSIGTKLKSKLYYPFVFGSFGKGSFLSRPVAIIKPQHIHIGAHVHIRPGARLEVIVLHQKKPPHFQIGDNVGIEQNVHIVCHHRVVIEDDVSITANCCIVDTTHPFQDVPFDAKVGAGVQDDEGFVEIGRGTLLGFGCVVLPNVRIGKGCVIGANSVVIRNIPDYSLAAGNPARVLGTIKKTPPDPTFPVYS